ncbi:invasion protein regulator [Sphingorhabdus sp. SMR4y]|nr:invasion protein regulator [Sphingorhabdus sp. SMR4y]
MDFANRQEKLSQPVAAARFSLFGGFQLLAPDGSEIIISNRRARAVAAMLCLAPDEPIDRDHLSKLLWPGRFEAQARASLRQCLLDLRKLLAAADCELLEVSRSRVSLNGGSVRSDLADLENALAAGDWAQATALLLAIGGKQILDQLHFGEDFETWLAERRQSIEQRLQTSVSDALAKLKASGNLADHEKLLDAWMVRHPAASRVIMAGRQSGRTRLAILPFASLDSKDDHGYFADGIVDELITTLGQIPQLLVAGRTSSFQFKDTHLSLPEIADVLRVSHLVEGSVQRQDADVRINVRLIDGQTGFESWGYSYDGTEDDIFASREQVARTVTRELCTALELDIVDHDVRRMTDNKAAYGLYLQGRALTRRAIGDGVLETAIKLLEQALELEPEFAECWTALAEAHVYTSVFTPCLDKLGEAERMAECARNAIALSPKQGHAYAMLGLYQWTRNDAVGALDLAFKAYELEPENPAVVMRLGSFLLYCGRTAEALPYVEAAIDQDPVDGRNYAMLCAAHLNLGNIEAAIEAGQRMADMGQPSLHLAAATATSGDRDLAMEQYQKSRSLMNSVIFAPAGMTPMAPEAMDAYWLLAARGIHSGDEEARQQYCQVLEMLHATLPDPCDPTIVWPAVWMGYAPMVFKTLGQQITPPNMVGLMSLWADVEPIRQTRMHPEFMDFARRIGLVAAWEKYGWPDLLPDPSAPN